VLLASYLLILASCGHAHEATKTMATAPAVFASSSTGAIRISDIYSERVDPGYSKWLTLDLTAKADLNAFERFEKPGVRIAHATIADPGSGTYYRMDGVRVLWHRETRASDSATARIAFDHLRFHCGPPSCKTSRDSQF